MQDTFQTMSGQITGRIGNTSSRIDNLEKHVAGLMTQAGVEELEGENKVPPTPKSRSLLTYTEIRNTHFYKPREEQMA